MLKRVDLIIYLQLILVGILYNFPLFLIVFITVLCILQIYLEIVCIKQIYLTAIYQKVGAMEKFQVKFMGISCFSSPSWVESFQVAPTVLEKLHSKLIYIIS